MIKLQINKKLKLIFFLSFLFFIYFSKLIFSFGLLDAREDGIVQPGIWENGIVEIYVTGDLPDLDNEIELLDEIIEAWNDVETSDITIINHGELTDSTIDPLDQSDGYNVVYFDDDGSVTESIGGDANSILGFAYPFTNSSETEAYFYDSVIVLNGTLVDESSFISTFLHEFGHLLGLDHTANIPEDSDWEELSTMFSYNLSSEQSTLHRDDEAAISAIYPNAAFHEDWGALSGVVQDEFGIPQFGVAVIAYDATTGQPITSTLTGMPLYFSSSYEVAGLGNWLLPIPSEHQVMLKLKCGPWGLDGNIIDEAGGSGIGSADFGKINGYLDNPLEREGFDLGCPEEWYPNNPTEQGAYIITVDENTVKEDINFTTWYAYDNSIRVSIYTDCPDRFALSVLIGEDYSDPDATILLTHGTDSDDVNVYYEAEIDDTYESYLPPSSTQKWFLKVQGNISACSYKTLLNFMVKHGNNIYLPTDIADYPKSISTGANYFEIDGSQVLTSATAVQFDKELTFEAAPTTDTTSDVTVGDIGETSENSDGTTQTTSGCMGCFIDSKATSSKSDLIFYFLLFLSIFLIRVYLKKTKIV
ncbi:MAG: matrixin family metalloprotease [Pseudomonadota bacterium]